MHAKLVEVGAKLASKLSSLGGTVKTTFTNLRKDEIAEALIATWCVEFLRMRRLGSFNVVEIIVVSVLMLGVRTIINEAARRKHGGTTQKSVVVSDRITQVGQMEFRGNRTKTFQQWF